MRSTTRFPVMLLIMTAALLPAAAQQPVEKIGQEGTGDMGRGHQQDMRLIHSLFAAHLKITRQVTEMENGVITITESADPEVQVMLRAHAQAMKRRLDGKLPIRQWDPLFAALFESAALISMEVIPTARGVRVIESSKDLKVASLIRAHAASVTEFVKDGAAVMHKLHPIPLPQ